MKTHSRFTLMLLRLLCAFVLISVLTVTAPVASTAQAAAALQVTPVTWNIIGLDSNNVSVGPNHFPIGARVCNTGDQPALNVKSQMVWTSSDPYINFRSGSMSAYTENGTTLAAHACMDFYYEVEVTRDANAYNHTREYRIDASADGGLSGSTPTPRELFVEHLISQSRNSVNGVRLNGVSIANGGTMALLVGQTYTIELDGATATNGYNQLESFINFSNTIFQILSVQTTYSVGGNNDRLYSDACGWDNVPSSPTYRSCIVSDNKAGGTVTTVYRIKIIGGAGTTQTLSTLLYDFSGSSFHYNSDFDVSARFASIIDPTSITIDKSFSPNPTAAKGSSTLTFSIHNPNDAPITGVNFTDTLPTAPGAMVVANPSGASTNNCGTSAVFSPAPGSASLSFSNGTLAANGTCTIKVNVTAPVVGIYNNVSGPLQFTVGTDTISSGNTASASLTANDAPLPPAPICGQVLASWTFTGSSATNPIPANQTGSGVSRAEASFSPAGQQSIDTGVGSSLPGGSGVPSLVTYGWENKIIDYGVYYQFLVDTRNYSNVQFQFSAYRKSPGPNNLYVYYNTTGAAPSGAAFASYANILASNTTWYRVPSAASTIDFSGRTSTTGNTTFYILANGANNASSGADLHVDDVTITGCTIPQPPTLSKTFSSPAVGVGGTANLTFSVTNPNGIGLTGVQFNDTLPAGVVVATGSSAQCGGTVSTTAPSTIAFSGGTLAANGSCTITVPVTVTTAGPHDNVSGFISSTQTGINNSPSGFATASINGLLPPEISKSFAPNPVLAGKATTLTFVVSNPNLNDPLTGVGFTDPLPDGMTVANPPNAAASGCGSPTFAPTAGDASLSFSGATLLGGASCVVSVDVTAPVGTYNNTSNTVTSSSAGSGNTASDSLTTTPPHPSMVFSKQISTSPSGPWTKFVAVEPGSDVYYRFTVENTGDVDLTLTSPVVNDALVDLSGCAWPATLPVGTATVDPSAYCIVGPITAAAGDHPNTASAQYSYSGTSHTTPASSADYMGTQPGLDLVKEVAASASGPWTALLTGVEPGADIYYRFTVTNTGNVPLSPVSVDDPQVSASGCSFTNPLPVGGSTSCVVGPLVASTTAGTYTNTATAHGVYPVNPDIAGDSPASSASYSLASPDFVLVKTHQPAGDATVGSPFTWELVVSNSDTTEGTFTDGQIILSDTLPAGASYGSPAAGSFTNITNPGNISCAITSGKLICQASGKDVTIGAGGSFTVTLSATPAAQGLISNTASVDPEKLVAEASEDNNSATDALKVTNLVDLGISKDDGLTNVTPNTAVQYAVVVENAGPGDASGAILTDPSIPGLNVTGVTCGSETGGATCPAPASLTVSSLQGAGVVIPTLPGGSTLTFTIDATVTATSGTTTNVAEIAAPASATEDTSIGSLANTSSDTDTVTPTADLGITKDDGNTSVHPIDTVNYAIVVRNAGPSAANGAILTDASVPGLNVTGITCGTETGGAVCPTAASATVALLQGTGIVIPTLPANSSLTFTLTASVTATNGSVTNTAVITAPAGVTELTGAGTLPNSAADTDSIQPTADLGITKTDGVDTILPDGTVSYSIVVSNAGPSAADGAILTDPNVPGITINSVTCDSESGGAVCSNALSTTVPLLQGTGIVIPTLPAGSSLTYTVNATITADSGTVTNTANITVPSGVTELAGAGSLPNTASDADSVTPTTDLGVTKTDGIDTIEPGTAVSYTIVVNNAGPSAADGAILTDPAVPGITVNSISCGSETGGATCPDAASLTVSALQGAGIVLPTLPASSSLTISVSATITAATGAVTNTAQIEAPSGVTELTDPGSLANTAADTDAITVTADLGVVKSDGVGSVLPGETVSYTITVSNAGPSDADGAILTDPSVSGLNVTGITCGPAAGGAACPDAVSTTVSALQSSGIVIPTLPSGSSLTFTVNATVTAAGGSITNTASVAAPAGVTELSGPGAQSNTSTDTDTVAPLVDLGITKDDSQTEVFPGDTVSYAVVVSNAGPSAADGAVLTDPGAAGLITNSVVCGAETGGASCPSAADMSVSLLQSTGIVIPALPAGSNLTFTVNATVAAATGSVTNTVAIAAPVGATENTAPGTLDNGASDTDTVTSTADLGISKDDGMVTVTPNEIVSYSITVRNAGPSAAGGAILTDPSVPGITANSLTCGSETGGAVCPDAASLTVSALQGSGIAIPVLPAGSSMTFTVNATVAAAGGTITNAAAISAPSGVTELSGAGTLPNSASDTDTVTPTADLGVVKDDGQTSVFPNDTVNYSIVVGNAGPSAADGAILTDPATAGFDVTGVSCGSATGGAVCPNPVDMSVSLLQGTGILIPTLPANSNLTFSVTAAVTASSGSITNTASVSVPAGVIELSGTGTQENNSSDTDTVTPTADLGITKDDGIATIYPNGTVSYTVVVSNAGPSDADGAVMTDPVVPGITVNSVTCGTEVGGAVCPGAADLTVTLLQGTGVVIPTLPANSSLTFTIDATITATSDTVTNTAAITAPTGVTELTGAGTDPNSASDADTSTGAPVLTITKDDGHSVVSPGAALTYAITVSNTGTREATGVTVVDILPDNVTFVNANQGGVYDDTAHTVTWPAFTLPIGTSNAVTFHVTVQVKDSPTGTSLSNYASASDDGSSSGGTPISDEVTDTDAITAGVTKSLLTSSDEGSPSPKVLIGEILTYQISLTVPPGTMTDLSALDILDSGLAFVRCSSISAGTLTTNLPGGFAPACSAPTNPMIGPEPVSSTAAKDQGRRIQFTFGDVTNSGTAEQTLRVEYQVVVLNIAENKNGTGNLNNRLTWTWDGGTLSGAAAPVEITEARISIQKSASTTVATPNARITFTLTVKHASGSAAVAYNVTVTDKLPKGLKYVPGTLRMVKGPAGVLLDDSQAPTLSASWLVFNQTDAAEITFDAVYTGGQSVVNTANVTWESLLADPSGPQSPYNTRSTERKYDPADKTVNNYYATDKVVLQPPSGLPTTGFAPGRVTVLPEQPESKRYAALGDLWLEIPRLKLSLPITGVPLDDDNWDLSWLANQAGYLDGTTYPGQVGTTGITAHVTLADGTAGPFQNLGQLRWGDQIVLHAWGAQYVYEVRSNSVVKPEDVSVFANDGYSWLTLITCKNYNEAKNAYENRLAVRAVLIKVNGKTK